ncbi:hypothetical protein DSM104443_02676 [Usitatibacter rugosus]|uniref:DUF3306 domain-containing protein n=1 Tax=Usitatibacter rugosus TaxID=2732067 RepID=A0A6M4H167_9PROT|nr:DUF3306 domain-containing protein [Usitatibacter rugosus]QJR11597.1 hypothetical protein DSM104443_02676 [Usitatibacter rugosus]
MTDEPFLSRWSRRKKESRSGAEPPPPAAPAPAEAVVTAPPAAAAEPLPPVESLTPESDFTGFMKPEVDEGLKRRALKTLFQDPHFNVMDGLDVYIDDYSKPDPLPEGWLAKMNQVARLGDYQEPKPEAAGERDPDPTSTPAAELEKPEKPSPEQGLEGDSGGYESDTRSAGTPPPPVSQ